MGVRRRTLALTAAGLVVVVVGAGAVVRGCGSDVPAQPMLIRIATGSTAAVYYQYGQALAGIINREVSGVRASVLVTDASVTNVKMVREGRAELAFTQADILIPGDAHDLVALARVYDDELHLVVRTDGPIRTLADLRGHKVSTGADGSGTYITADRLLKLANVDGAITQVREGLDNSVKLLRDGAIDAFFFSGGLPVAAVRQLADERLIRLVDLSGQVPEMRRTYSEVYGLRAVPNSVYNLEPVNTIGDPNYLVVRPGLPERVAYELTRVLIQRRDELGRAHPAAEWLDSRTALNTTPLALHPGAVRYYRDAKE